MLFMILMAIVLIGLLTAAISMTSRPEGTNIDKESLLIKTTEVQRYASELERAVLFILQENGKSEVDIRFSHPQAHADYGDLTADADKTDQVFAREGGAASFRTPPEGIQVAPAPWEFNGGTALPQVGSSKPDLVAVLPNVTQQFCERINNLNGQTSVQPMDTGGSAASGSSAGDCVSGGADVRFDAAQQFYDPPSSTENTVNEASFTVAPALQACVQCTLGGYHFYHVLLAR
jgi:hypothetical protein